MRRGLWWLVGIIVLVVIIAGGYAASHKSSNNTSTTYPSSSQSSTGTQTSNSIIQTKSDPKVGQYLADNKGNALYTFGGDTKGVSNCTGSCLSAWPVYQASSSTASLPSGVTVITRSDGTKQYAYDEMPLYTFTGDSPGQVTGDGVSNFHVAKPS